ncbi:MAG: RimK family alpha-L-glutamate ligase [Candidatus Hermodarchaeota archaeon]
MVQIGLIIDKYHLEYKVKEFLEYCRKIADVTIYLEEDFLLDFNNENYNEDIFFAKAKGDLILSMVKLIENITTIPVINSSKGIFLAYNRFLNSVFLKKAGIKVPEFSLLPINKLPKFKDYIIKNIRDQKNYSFKPDFDKSNGSLRVKDVRAVQETEGSNALYKHYYFQEFIKSKWEYKIYLIGENLYFFKQLPILVNPNKMQSRSEIPIDQELAEVAFKAAQTLDLEITSMDFLKSNEGVYYLTDINSSPNFNYLPKGPQLVGDYLKSRAKS